MSEDRFYAIAWDVTSRIRMTAILVVAGWFLYRLLNRFLPRQVAMRVGVIFSVVLLVLYWAPWELTASMAFAGATAAAAAAACLLCPRGERRLMILLCISYAAVRQAAASVANAVNSSLYDVWVMPPVLQSQEDVLLRGFIGASAVEVALNALLLYLAVRIICRTWPEGYFTLRAREMLLLVLPSCAALATTYALVYFRMAIDYSAIYVTVEWIAAGVHALLFAVIIGTFTLFAVVVREQRAQARQQVLDAQMLGLRQYVGDLEALYEDLRSFRHDTANHLETISGLEAAGRTEEAAGYLMAARERLGESFPEIDTGNAVTDVILSAQRAQAARLDVPFRSTFRYPAGGGFDPFDIGIILHNAGANALEHAASCEDPFVEVRSAMHNNALVIEYRNRFCGALELDHETGLPTTSKQDTKSHGIGMSNIRSTAERYNGACEISVQDGVCTLTVLLAAARGAGGARR